MSASATSPPADMTVAASPGLAMWIVLAGATAAGLSLLYLPWTVAWVVCAVLPLYGWKVLRLHALQQHAASITALRCEPGALGYRLNSGEWLSGNVAAGGLVSRWLTLVRVRDYAEPPQNRYLVLVPGRLSADSYRRLRVHLRWNLKQPGNRAGG